MKSEKAKPNVPLRLHLRASKVPLLLHKKVVVDRVAYENAHDERWEKELELLRANHKKPFESVWEKTAILQKVTTNIVCEGVMPDFFCFAPSSGTLIGLVCVRVHRFSAQEA